MGRLRNLLKTTFLTGIAVLVPIAITFYVLGYSFLFFDNLLLPLVTLWVGHPVRGLGLLALFLLILSVGVVSSHILGQRLVAWMEAYLRRLPVVKSFYAAVKSLVDAFSPTGREGFREVVIVQYPRQGVYSVGFLIKECSVENSAHESQQCEVVYLPTNHLYIGVSVILPKEEVVHTHMSVGEGIQLILSGGVSTPERITRR